MSTNIIIYLSSFTTTVSRQNATRVGQELKNNSVCTHKNKRYLRMYDHVKFFPVTGTHQVQEE
ncbi:hypothetical protein NTE_02948 [Candidatus Nitrososphaera evergladensis SR1]|uniref:Uncharacterized protein n=1 Tax=Candidatus Nitrososphaera evergladensis SR1 TaxID=1459636 RepID=A0A075N0H4_9ARCH|nr:hypothetical protein NTE_02948 [Candidatus Nitrososphaera evergladensis SR1]